MPNSLGLRSTACSRFPEARGGARARSRAFAWLLLLAALSPGANADAAAIDVKAARQGNTFEVSADAVLQADAAVAWEVLTDYDRLADFIPGMHSSTLVSRDGNRAVVDQRGEASLLFFHFPIEVRLAIEEQPPERIESRAVAGNFRELEGAYRLEADGARLRLQYHGRFTPDFDIPPLIGTMLVRHTLQLRFGAMVEEILRRQAQRMPTPAEPR
jgi:ribosome-associated toxin RatA of RatAB toxin-antitoxin module